MQKGLHLLTTHIYLLKVEQRWSPTSLSTPARDQSETRKCMHEFVHCLSFSRSEGELERIFTWWKCNLTMPDSSLHTHTLSCIWTESSSNQLTSSLAPLLGSACQLLSINTDQRHCPLLTLKLPSTQVQKTSLMCVWHGWNYGITMEDEDNAYKTLTAQILYFIFNINCIL